MHLLLFLIQGSLGYDSWLVVTRCVVELLLQGLVAGSGGARLLLLFFLLSNLLTKTLFNDLFLLFLPFEFLLHAHALVILLPAEGFLLFLELSLFFSNFSQLPLLVHNLLRVANELVSIHVCRLLLLFLFLLLALDG